MTITHGHVAGGKASPEYSSWAAMRSRCLYPSSNRYRLYGGRGITVCERWDNFQNFIADMGLKPTPEHSIERINGNGNYEPGNCKWATPIEQGRNKSNNRLVTIHGVTKCVTQWAEELGLDPFAVFKRLRKGETPERALRPPERQMVNGEYLVCRKGLHAFPEWRRDVPSGPYCVLCKRAGDAHKRQQRRESEVRR